MLTKFHLHGKNINLTGDNVTISSNNFNVDKDGNMTCNNANITGGQFNVTASTSATDTIRVTNQNNSQEYSYLSPTAEVLIGSRGRINLSAKSNVSDHSYVIVSNNEGAATTITEESIQTPSLNQTSKEELKKNFEKFSNALAILKNIDIYKYNLKTDKDGTKKHIGFVIGKDFNYSQEVTSKNNDGVDIYSFISLCCQAIKEQQKEIEELKNKIKEEN